jgi:predicted nicotinamide N-methyase
LPELRLYRAGPASGLARLVSGAGAPYWAYPWAGGLALARYILDHPATVAQKRILDLGAGGGVVAIAATKAGARQATAIDVDPDSIDAIALNAHTPSELHSYPIGLWDRLKSSTRFIPCVGSGSSS